MFFTIYFWLVFITYIAYFLCTIGYEMYKRYSEAAMQSSHSDESVVDISDELREFKPVIVLRPPSTRKRENAAMIRKRRAELLMTGGIEVEELIPKVSDFVQKGADSELARLVDDWKDQ